ncbi:ATP-binding protein [Streptomyces sp. NPDC004658]|uniref:ATP-binding protein n=1 Tax=Streptomyces sp. NPDC004658 TaxID=3154672 RepID=UPI0033B7DF74
MIQPGDRPETLVGRLREIDFLQRFVHQSGVNGGTLLLSGEPGVGKTALLEATAGTARASGTTVLRVTGAEFEAEVSFAGLNQALFPLIDEFRRSATNTPGHCGSPWASRSAPLPTGSCCPTPWLCCCDGWPRGHRCC